MSVFFQKNYILSLPELAKFLQKTAQLEKKIEILDSLPQVKEYFASSHSLKKIFGQLTKKEEFLIKAIAAIGQAPILFHVKNINEETQEKADYLLCQLNAIEDFYEPIGGIIGYHNEVLELLQEEKKEHPAENITYHTPQGINLEQETDEVLEILRKGLESHEVLVEIYPVGGAGERLNLCDPISKEALPVALLQFWEHSLLEGLIRDLQGREYLFFKLFKKQITTPLILMTSQEKNADLHIRTLCKKRHFFGRPESSIFFCTQPLVPVLTIEGNWSLIAPLTLNLKPCGHGVVWKVCRDSGAFAWLKKQKKKAAIIRQINNPMAGIDTLITALLGEGIRNHKNFGFAACEKRPEAAEGIDVLIERKEGKNFTYTISNIEYTDMKRKHVHSSSFPANTNILFANLEAIQDVLDQNPFPGILLNMKGKVPFYNEKGECHHITGGRLETTMQNISDLFAETFPHRLSASQQKNLKTYVVYNKRQKTISVTKKAYKPGESILDTPVGAFFDLLQVNQQLLKEYCEAKVPSNQSIEEYLQEGPRLIFIFHPALGPYFSIIRQKIIGGVFESNSELHLEIADVKLKNLKLQGSLIVRAENVLGEKDSEGMILYDKNTGKCQLHNVEIHNKGIQRSAPNVYWKNQIKHLEKVEIILHGNAEFFAENIKLEGAHRFEVPSGYRYTLTQEENEVKIIKEIISHSTWHWQYDLDEQNHIFLTKRRKNL